MNSRNVKMISFATTALLGMPFVAIAIDGTVDFRGEIVEETCTVNTESQNLTVLLPKVSTTALSQAGDVAGSTPFTISLSGCAAGNQVAAYFEPGSTVDFTTGRLKNTANTTVAANNVQIQLRDSTSTALPILGVASDDVAQTGNWTTADAGGSLNLNYYAEYFATDATTPGVVTSNVQYTIIYD